MNDDERLVSWDTLRVVPVEFSVQTIDPRLFTLLSGLHITEVKDFSEMTDAEREQAGWVRVPEDDPDFDMDYCAWRKR